MLNVWEIFPGAKFKSLKITSVVPLRVLVLVFMDVYEKNLAWITGFQYYFSIINLYWIFKYGFEIFRLD